MPSLSGRAGEHAGAGSAAQHSTAQHSTAQHSTAQHSGQPGCNPAWPAGDGALQAVEDALADLVGRPLLSQQVLQASRTQRRIEPVWPRVRFEALAVLHQQLRCLRAWVRLLAACAWPPQPLSPICDPIPCLEAVLIEVVVSQLQQRLVHLRPGGAGASAGFKRCSGIAGRALLNKLAVQPPGQAKAQSPAAAHTMPASWRPPGWRRAVHRRALPTRAPILLHHERPTPISPAAPASRPPS